MNKDIFITAAKRTPIGSFQGCFETVGATELGGAAIGAMFEGRGELKDKIDDLIMGCVLPAGLGQAPARQAGFHAGLPESIPATTINKMCGSGMKSVMLGYDQISSGSASLIVAGGMESMTNAPYLLSGLRGGARIGDQKPQDHMFLDGLEDAYDKGRLMGCFAEDCAQYYQLSRQSQDIYALTSLDRVKTAQKDGVFAPEITPITVNSGKVKLVVNIDELPLSAQPDKIPHLRPVFLENGTITAANSSSISDGAAALMLADSRAVTDYGLTIRARIAGHAGFAHAPGWFTTAPVHAVTKLLSKLDWTISDVDLWEVNEAFAVVPMAFMHELNIVPERMNIHGGACALGHPIGASGARILVTLLHALETYDMKKGIAAICLGGGEAIAVALERK